MPVVNLLLAVDDSPESRKGAKFGFYLAKELKASVAIILVVDKTHEMVNPDLGITPEEKRASMKMAAQATIDQLISMP